MNRFYARDGQFWLDDNPLFIHAGEFHYFRTPTDQWSHRLGLLQTAGFNAVASYIPWLWHQPEENLTDLEGHTHPLRNLAGFLDLAADTGLYIIARPGPYIMAETINEGVPPWLFARYPEAAFVGQDGKSRISPATCSPISWSASSAGIRPYFRCWPRARLRAGARSC